MAHWAQIVSDTVTKVVTGESPPEEGTWVKTSYNMRGGVYFASSDQSVISGDEARERKNYAGVGYSYDGTGFSPPKPYDNWTLNDNSYLWEPPVTSPDDGKKYEWNQNENSWDEVE